MKRELWVKVCESTPEKPEVAQIAKRLGVSRDEVVGILVRFWSYVERHLPGGRSQNLAWPELVDEILGVEGLCRELQKVGWLKRTRDEVVIPNYERHLGQVARSRATDARRKAQSRRVKVAEGEEKPHAEVVEEVKEKGKQKKLEGHTKEEWVNLLQARTAQGMVKLNAIGRSWERLIQASRNHDGKLWRAIHDLTPRPLDEFYRNWGKCSWHWLLERKGKLEEYLDGTLFEKQVGAMGRAMQDPGENEFTWD